MTVVVCRCCGHWLLKAAQLLLENSKTPIGEERFDPMGIMLSCPKCMVWTHIELNEHGAWVAEEGSSSRE